MNHTGNDTETGAGTSAGTILPHSPAVSAWPGGRRWREADQGRLFNPAHAIIYLALIASSIVLLSRYDFPVARYFHNSDISERVDTGWIKVVMRAPGDYPFAAATAIIMLAVHPRGWEAAGMVLLSGAAGAINGVIKWVTGRMRPFKGEGPFTLDFFHNGVWGFFHQTNLSFTSGHTTQAFAWAEMVSIVAPRLRPLVFAWAVVTGVQRVVSTAHWLTDAVAGAALGIVTVRVAFRILTRLVPPPAQAAIAARPLNVSVADTRGEYARVEHARAELAAMTDFIASPAGQTSIAPARPQLSLVIPCYNEEENVPTLLKRVGDSMAELGRPFEVLIIDDGSTDRTPQMLADAQKTLPWLRIVRMAKNSGQSAGFEAGFTAARGDYIATIDADLQNDPEEVPRLAKLLDENPSVDMITGWRKDRQDTNFRRWQSRQANKIRNWISQDDINDSASSLKIYRARTLKGLKLFNGAHRFFPALVRMRGFNVMETPVKHSQRFAGTAKYGFRNRAFRAFIDLLGVRWMKMRYLRYSCSEVSGNIGHSADGSAGDSAGNSGSGMAASATGNPSPSIEIATQ